MAIGQLDALIANFPGQKSYLKTKARFLTTLKQKDEALQLYRQILTLDAEDTDANLAVLSVGQDSEKPNAYLMSLLPVIANPSVNIEAKIAELLPYIQNLARGNNQDVKAALAEIGNKLVLTHPDDARAYSLHGDVLFHSGDTQGAIHRYEQTLKLNDKVFSVWEQLMYAYYEVGDIEKLYDFSYKAIDIYPNQSVNYYFHALACAAKKQFKTAKDTAEEGLIVSGGNPIQVSKLQTAIAITCIGSNDLATAQTAIDAALAASNQKNGFAVEVQGDLEMAKGNGNAAAAFYKKSLELGNNSKALLQKLETFK
ncbi:MAG: hypothetical protein IPN29_21895 [Saprospiraceae bacterium]|nr:hypothetical protein [Saprospiraceae bacterium]